MDDIPIGAWRMLSARQGRSFTLRNGKLADAGPVEAGTLVTVDDLDGSTAYVRTKDGRKLRVMRSVLTQRPKIRRQT